MGHGSADHWLFIAATRRPSPPLLLTFELALELKLVNPKTPGMSFHVDWTLAGIARGVAGVLVVPRMSTGHSERPRGAQFA
jgi:hypothetical protein